MITIHHLGISQSERIIWLCEELGLPYELKRYDRDAKTRLAPEAYKALHPMGLAPVIYDGDLVLAESGAIIDYIIAKYGEGRLVRTADHPDFADYLFWYHFANGTMMPSIMMDLIRQAAAPNTGEAVLGRGGRAFALVETWLATHAYFAGSEFSAADIMMLFALTTMRSFARRDLTHAPNTLAYLKRIGERPAYQRAMAKGDPGYAPNLS